MAKKTNFKKGIAILSVLAIGSFTLSQWFFTGNQEDVYSSMKEKYGITSTTTEVVEESVNTDETVTENVEETNVETTAPVIKPMPGKTETRKVAGKMMVNAYIERTIWDNMIANGYSEIQASAAIGNLIHESAGLNTDIFETANGEGYGLMQWSFGRKQNLFAYCDSKGKAHSDVNCQIEFMLKELDSSQFYEPQKSTFKNPYSVKEATEAFCWGFERPRKSTAAIDDRIAYAWDVYYHNHQGN